MEIIWSSASQCNDLMGFGFKKNQLFDCFKLRFFQLKRMIDGSFQQFQSIRCWFIVFCGFVSENYEVLIILTMGVLFPYHRDWDDRPFTPSVVSKQKGPAGQSAPSLKTYAIFLVGKMAASGFGYLMIYIYRLYVVCYIYI